MRRAQAEKLQHLQEIAALHLNTIESLAIAIAAKDQTTHGHVRRTQVYAMGLGRLLNVSAEELEAMKRLLADSIDGEPIGKVNFVLRERRAMVDFLNTGNVAAARSELRRVAPRLKGIGRRVW